MIFVKRDRINFESAASAGNVFFFVFFFNSLANYKKEFQTYTRRSTRYAHDITKLVI